MLWMNSHRNLLMILGEAIIHLGMEENIFEPQMEAARADQRYIYQTCRMDN